LELKIKKEDEFIYKNQNYKIKINKPYEPEDIVWKNLTFDPKLRVAIILTNIILLLIFFLMTQAIVFTYSIFDIIFQLVGSNISENLFLFSLKNFVPIIFNVIIGKLVNLTTPFEFHVSKSNQNTSKIIKSSLLVVFNTGFYFY
jgi:hypothetical protein